MEDRLRVVGRGSWQTADSRELAVCAASMAGRFGSVFSARRPLEVPLRTPAAAICTARLGQRPAAGGADHLARDVAGLRGRQRRFAAAMPRARPPGAVEPEASSPGQTSLRGLGSTSGVRAGWPTAWTRRAGPRGCTPPMGWRLESLSNDWHAFHGIQLQDHQDLDVVVGPGGLFYFQTKNGRGLFSQDANGRALHNGKPTSLPAQTLAQAMNLKDRLAALLRTSDVWMNAVLAVPFAFVEGPSQYGGVLLLHQDSLVEVLERRPATLNKDPGPALRQGSRDAG
jgi:Nuclease-related domain